MSSQKILLSNELHKELLNDIYMALGRDQKLIQTSFENKEWIHLGFQSDDPVTDFRGTGELGLLNIHYLVTSEPQKANEMLIEANETERHYFFACTGINITLKLFFLICKDHINLHKFESCSDAEDALLKFNFLYVKFFEDLHDYWRNSPLSKSIMNYNLVLNEFFENYKKGYK